MIKRDGKWEEVDWQTRSNSSRGELKRIRDAHGAASDRRAGVAAPTLEELYLLQKLVRGLGSGNVDFRLRQSDFAADGELRGAPWLGMKIAEIDAARPRAGDRQHAAQGSSAARASPAPGGQEAARSSTWSIRSTTIC